MRHESSTGSVPRWRRFEPEALNVPAAREFVAQALAGGGFRGDTNTVLLLVSELATNAVRHAATPFEITVDVQDAGVRVAVIDQDIDHPPQVGHPRPEDTNGRGLLIVDELAARWGSHEVGAGSKAVWFTVA